MGAKIFTHIRHPEYRDCLKGVTDTGNQGDFLRPGMAGVYRTQDSLDMYVLTQADDYPVWEHPESGDVSLWNTHPTGELRWAITYSAGVYHMNPNELMAVKYFGLKLKSVTPERWEEILESQLFKLEDLSEIEVKLLKRAGNSRDGSRDIVSEEKVKILGDGAENWHHTIRQPPERDALHDLEEKGLTVTTGSISMTTGQNSHIWRTTVGYKITTRGREILDKGKA